MSVRLPPRQFLGPQDELGIRNYHLPMLACLGLIAMELCLNGLFRWGRASLLDAVRLMLVHLPLLFAIKIFIAIKIFMSLPEATTKEFGHIGKCAGVYRDTTFWITRAPFVTGFGIGSQRLGSTAAKQ
jgi:hypothetical protein